jgi:prepilin-type N-terminal cleavage/methylation domain-containing protein
MKMNFDKKWFSLVELLVVITILSIISVVAYQNFWWAVDKAVSGRKISDVSTIETSLSRYKIDNNYYPAAWEYDATNNMWWYNETVNATPSNTISVTMDWAEIQTIDGADGGWVVYNTKATPQQIGSKWTISQDELWKNYLTKDLFDPEIWDLEEWSTWDELIEKWLWRYVYWVYRKPTWADWSGNNKTWTAYNIAYTIKKEWTDYYTTKIVWDYDSANFTTPTDYPQTLIWSASGALTNVLTNESIQNGASSSTNYGVPYAVTDFAQ